MLRAAGGYCRYCRREQCRDVPRDRLGKVLEVEFCHFFEGEREREERMTTKGEVKREEEEDDAYIDALHLRRHCSTFASVST